MKKIILTTLSLASFTILAAHATTTYEQLYSCSIPIKRANDSKYFDHIIPGKVMFENDCKIYEKSSPEYYNSCIQTARKENQKSLDDLKSGKCKPTLTRAIKKINNHTCYIDLKNNHKQLFVKNQGVIFDNNTILNSANKKNCIDQLAKDIKKRYSVTELHNLNHHSVKKNIIPHAKINNTILSPYYECKYNIESFKFNPINVHVLDYSSEDRDKRYQNGYNALKLELCKQNQTQAEYSSRYYSCNIEYDKNGKIVGNFYSGDGTHSEDLDNCYTQLFHDVKQEVPNLHGESRWAKYGVPQTPSKFSTTKEKVTSKKSYNATTTKTIPNNSPTKTTTPVKVNMPSAPIYK